MIPDGSLYLVCGGWALAMLAILISAIRLSYQIEGRSPDLRNTSGVPRNAMMAHTVLNSGVARDKETQAMRRAMNWRLAGVAVGFVVMVAGLRLAGAWN